MYLNRYLVRLYFLFKGIKLHSSVKFMGPLIIKGSIKSDSIFFGKNIIIQPNVEIKVRGSGKIILEDNVQLDTNVRIIAAEDRIIHIKDGGQIGFGTILNGGENITIGKGSAIASNCLLQASEHKLPVSRNTDVVKSGYVRGKILIGKSVWIAANVVIRPNSTIEDNVVVGAFSIVKGFLEKDGLYAGLQLKKIR